jgi:hypothetical protein
VRKAERACHIAEDRNSLGDAKPFLVAELVAQRFADDERHHEIGQLVRYAGREHRHDVRMLELCGQQYLALESFGVESGGKIGPQYLYYDRAAKRRVFGHENARHTASAELPPEVV